MFMTIGSILLGAALLIVVLLYLARPLLRQKSTGKAPQTQRQQLLNQKEATITQILSLDFDFETGKVPQTLYEQQRSELIAEAAIILERLDSLPQDEVVDAEIEAAIAHLREHVPAPLASTNGHKRYCPECGTAVDLSDKFCANCGHKLVTPPVGAAT